MKNKYFYEYDSVTDWEAPEEKEIKKYINNGWRSVLYGIISFLLFIYYLNKSNSRGIDVTQDYHYLIFGVLFLISGIYRLLYKYFPDKRFEPKEFYKGFNFIKIDSHKFVWKQGIFKREKEVEIETIRKVYFNTKVVYLYTDNGQSNIYLCKIKSEKKKEQFFECLNKMIEQLGTVK